MMDENRFWKVIEVTHGAGTWRSPARSKSPRHWHPFLKRMSRRLGWHSEHESRCLRCKKPSRDFPRTISCNLTEHLNASCTTLTARRHPRVYRRVGRRLSLCCRGFIVAAEAATTTRLSERLEEPLPLRGVMDVGMRRNVLPFAAYLSEKFGELPDSDITRETGFNKAGCGRS